LRAWVTDDGTGGAALAKGHGLQGLDDRVRAIGGRLLVTSPAGGPTTVTAELPC
jgi:signal transduction histidine kinase